MKTLTSFKVLLIIAAMVLVPYSLLAETEPNNTIQVANVLAYDGEQTGTLSSGDVDWYKVTLPDDGKWSVTFQGTNGLQCNNLELYDQNEKPLKSGTYGTTASVSYDNLGKGVYFLKVRYWSGTAGSYTVKSEFISARLSDDKEPNDVIDMAENINVGTAHTGRLYYRRTDATFDEVDWYKFTLTKSGKVRVDFTGDEPLRSNNLMLYDTNKTTVLATGDWGMTASVSKDNILPGTYFVKIPRYQGYGSYEVKVSFSEANLQDDIEPNDIQTQAQVIQLSDSVSARIGYQNGDITDKIDWYKVSIPENGQLKVTFRADKTLMLNNPALYTENGKSRSSSSSYGSQFSFSVPDLSKGDYWIYVPQYSGYGAYKMIAEFTPFDYPTDNEPNNSYETATELISGQTVTGQMGYWRVSGDMDVEDWYKITIPDNMAVKFTYLTDSVLQLNNPILYIEYNGELVNRYSSPIWKYNFNNTISDLAAGTYYLKVPRYAQYGAYKLTYTQIPLPVINDTEPNDKPQNAVDYSLNDSITGHLGYFHHSSTIDNDDYYKIRTNKLGDLILKVNVEKPLVHELFLYGPDSVSRIASHTAGYDTTRTMIARGLQPNTDYFLKIHRYGGYGYYYLTSGTREYQIGFDMSRFNNTVKIMNRSNGDRFEWNFGDGTATSAEKFPEHTYTQVGDFEITQKVWFTGNNTPYVTKKVFSVKGVDRYTPFKAGNGGDLAMTVYGGGLDKNTRIKLVKDTQILTPDTIITGKLGQIEAIFNLHFAETGVYDVSIGLQGEEPTLFKEGLTIEGIKYPYVVSTIEGYGTLRSGRTWRYDLALTNTGNVMANGVYAYIAVPYDVEFTSDLKPFSSTIDETKPFSYFDEELNKTFTVSNSKVKAVMDLLRTDYTEIDSLFNEPFKGRVYQLYIPKINAGSTLKIPFRVKSTSTAISSETAMQSFVTPINLFGSCVVPTSTEAQNKAVDLLLAGLENIPYVDKNPWFKTFFKVVNIGKTAMRNAASYAGYRAGGMSDEEAWHEAYIADGQLEKANAEAIAGLQDWAMELGLDKLKGLSDQQLLKYKEDRGLFTRMSLQAYKNGDKQGLSIWKGVAFDNQRRFERLKKMQNWLNNVVDFKDRIDAISEMGESDALEFLQIWVNECPEIKQKLPDILKHLLDNSGEGNLTKKSLYIGTSVDPNEIEGPKGFSAERYINNSQIMEYIIRFENKADAPMAAQIVNVYDTLNVEKYDLSTFELGHVTVGDSVVYFPKGRTEYFTKLDLRPVIDLKVGISAKLDTVTGIVHWQFISLDPVTNDLTNDPILGFLPPNQTAPAGEGSVAFRVKLKEDLPDAATVTNRASIVFDFNAPILTNIWKNTIDQKAPTGNVSDITLVNDTVFTVHWIGNDAGSKIRYYELYCSVNDADFVNLGRYVGNTATLKGELNSTYAFCTVPVDSVGNTETKNITAERKVTLMPNRVETLKSSYLSIYPNPAKDFLNIQLLTQDFFNNNCVVEVIGVDGKKHDMGVYTGMQLTEGVKISVKDFAKGLYLLRVIYDNQSVSQKVMVN